MLRLPCQAHSGRYRIWQLLLQVGTGLMLVQSDLARSEADSRRLQVCIADQVYPPYTYENAEGRLQYLVREAIAAHGWHVEFIAKPWRRCVLGIEQSAVQAIGPVFPSAEHMQRMVFPMRDGLPDTGHSLGMARMVVLRTAGSQVTWDGQGFSGLRGPLLYQSGVSALPLMLSSIQVDAFEGAPLAQPLAHMLLKGRSNAAIIHEHDALELLEQAEFQGRFEIQPFLSGAVYLGFSRQFYQQHKQEAEQAWDRIGRQREGLGKRELRSLGQPPRPLLLTSAHQAIVPELLNMSVNRCIHASRLSAVPCLQPHAGPMPAQYDSGSVT